MILEEHGCDLFYKFFGAVIRLLIYQSTDGFTHSRVVIDLIERDLGFIVCAKGEEPIEVLSVVERVSHNTDRPPYRPKDFSSTNF